MNIELHIMPFKLPFLRLSMEKKSADRCITYPFYLCACMLMWVYRTHVGSSVTLISSSSSMACLCHTGFASTGSVSREESPSKVEHHERKLTPEISTYDKKTKQSGPTYGLITGHGHQALLFDVGFGGGVTTSSVEPSVVDAQHHPVAQTLTTGHRALVETGQFRRRSL